MPDHLPSHVYAARLTPDALAPRIPTPAAVLSIVIPLYNEEETLPALYTQLKQELTNLGYDYEVIFVDDGSSDRTPYLLGELAQRDGRVGVIHLSRNFGHQAAVSTGLQHTRGDAIIVMDGDLQDPPEMIARLVQAWRSGAEVVYAVRRNRKEHWFKRVGYSGFYRVLATIGDLNIPRDAGDFCLMDRCVVEAMNRMPEHVRFVRGLRTYAGYRQVGVEYDRPARAAGDPKYTFRKLVALAIDGLVDFSSYPLRVVTYVGVFTVLLAMLIAGWAVIDAITNQSTPRGWASMIVVVLFMGAIQLISLGVVGEYVRRIFLEVKGRPNSIIRSIIPAGRTLRSHPQEEPLTPRARAS